MSKREIARLRGLVRHRRDRLEAGRFVVEGTKLVVEALASTHHVHQIVVDPQRVDPEVVDAACDDEVRILELAGHDLNRIADTTTAQPVLAEAELPVADLDTVQGATFVMVGVDLNDPGNVGTLVRTAEAAGCDAVVALGDCADPFGPKAVRASAGSVLRLPVVVERDASAGLEALADAGLQRLGTRMDDAEPCDEVDLTVPTALVLGSEAHGLDPSAQVDRWVRIPMAGSVESLNVAVAGAILAYETARQRRR